MSSLSFLSNAFAFFLSLKLTYYFQGLPAKLRLRLRVTSARDGGNPVTDQVDWSEP